MVSAINQSQPQFKATFKPIDSSILINEALRSENRRQACTELTSMLLYLRTLAEKKATLAYRSGTQNKYNFLLDGKVASKSNESFIDALRQVIKKRLGDVKLEPDETLSVRDCSTIIHNLSLSA